MGQRGFPLLAHVVFIEVSQLPLDRKYFAYRMPSSPKVTLLIESVSAPKAPFAHRGTINHECGGLDNLQDILQIREKYPNYPYAKPYDRLFRFRIHNKHRCRR